MDLFEHKGIIPMLLQEEYEPFNKKDFFYELKFDGIRAIAYINEGVELYSRNLEKLNNFKELNNINENVNAKCILDGEIIILDNGRISFSKLQQRISLKNNYRIKALSKNYPAIYVVFDILYVDNKSLIDFPLSKRRQYLDKVVNDSEFIVKSKKFENGIKLFQLVKEKQFEGIVAKKKNSIYQIGKRSNDWIKIKNNLESEFFIVGYDENSINSSNASIYLANKIDNDFHFIGSVIIGKNNNQFKKIKQLKKVNKNFYKNINEEIIFVEPRLVAAINFLEYTSSGGLRHPILKNIFDLNYNEIINSKL